MYKPTKKEIEELKVQHGDLYKLTVEDKCCFLKKPSRKTLGYASKASESNPLAFNEVILRECFVAGDTEIRDDDDYFLGASQKISQLIVVKNAELEKI
jgi:hypothetical protein